ncbi:MAG: helix-turn-helix transcriptional regulator [Candidatus Tectomicrobia bacterium]|nr:helix-turn-helix transcriptional regulator [Candidatus Tectomicrobia bacterium]
MPAVKDRQSALSPLEIRRGLAISQEQMSSLLRVSVKTVSRWEKNNGQPRDREQLVRLAQLKEISELGRAVYTPEGLKEFLSTPLPVFGGRTGFDFIQLGECEPVIRALAADFEGTGF